MSDPATHRCTVCGALWRLNPGETWSLESGGPRPGPCCDNAEYMPVESLGAGAAASLPPSYEDLARSLGAMVEKKQAAYGDSFGKSGGVMRALYPEGIPLEKLDDALTVVRIIDKLFRIATDRDALGEDPWADIEGYALLARRRRALERSKKEG